MVWTSKNRPEPPKQRPRGKFVRKFYAGLDGNGFDLKKTTQAAILAGDTALIKAIADLLRACAATKPVAPVSAADPAPVVDLASVPTEQLEALLAADKPEDPA